MSHVHSILRSCPLLLYLPRPRTSTTHKKKQIEHHLFPRISHVHYHKLAPIVKEWCKEHKLRYAYYPTLYSNVVSCAKYLHEMGNDATVQVG